MLATLLYTIALGSGTKDQTQFPAIQFTKSYSLTIHPQKDLNHAYAIKYQNQEVISQSLRLIHEPNTTPHSTIANIDDPVITTLQLQNHSKEDPTYQLFIQTIIMGFPTMKNDLTNAIRSFWEVQEQLSVSDKIILMDDCLVIFNNLRKSILRTLHSAHQGVSSMKSRANATVYWPVINNDIRNV